MSQPLRLIQYSFRFHIICGYLNPKHRSKVTSLKRCPETVLSNIQLTPPGLEPGSTA